MVRISNNKKCLLLHRKQRKVEISCLTLGLTRVGAFLKNAGLNSSLEDVSATRRETIDSFRWPECKEDPVGYALEKSVRMAMGNGQHVRLPYDTCDAPSPVCMGAVAITWPSCCPCRRERFAMCCKVFIRISICRRKPENDGYSRQTRVWRRIFCQCWCTWHSDEVSKFFTGKRWVATSILCGWTAG